MRTGILTSLGLWAVVAYLLIVGTGCAGMELGGRLGVYRVDEQQSSSKTYRQDTKPLKCLFVSCDNTSRRYRDPEDSGS